MHDYPPDGAYAIDDPYRPGTLSYWLLRGQGLEAWPLGDAGKYGPPRPPKNDPATTLEQRRDMLKYWGTQLEAYRLEVLRRIAADPAGAAARFTRETDRCHRCRGFHHAEHLPNSAAEGRGRAGGALTGEQRDAMVVALRRAEFSEALISEALGMPPGAVNRAARKAGIGAPLKGRGRGTVDAGQRVTVTKDRDLTGHDLTPGLEATVRTDRDNAGHDNDGASGAAVVADRDNARHDNTGDTGLAEGVVRDAFLASIALITREIDAVDVRARDLTDGADAEVSAQILASIVATVLCATLPDHGRRLLAHLSRIAVGKDAE